MQQCTCFKIVIKTDFELLNDIQIATIALDFAIVFIFFISARRETQLVIQDPKNGKNQESEQLVQIFNYCSKTSNKTGEKLFAEKKW